MARRTTLVLDDDVYRALVEESLKRYGSTRYLSKVANELLREALTRARERSALEELRRLLSRPKLARVTQEEFERFRAELSESLES